MGIGVFGGGRRSGRRPRALLGGWTGLRNYRNLGALGQAAVKTRLDLIPIDMITSLSSEPLNPFGPKDPKTGKLLDPFAPVYKYMDVVKGPGSAWVGYVTDRLTKAPGSDGYLDDAFRSNTSVIGPMWKDVMSGKTAVGSSGALPDSVTMPAMHKELYAYYKTILQSLIDAEKADLASVFYGTGSPNLARFATDYAFKFNGDLLTVTELQGPGLTFPPQSNNLAWGLDLRAFLGPNSGNLPWLGPDGTIRSFYNSLAVLSKVLAAYPWPEPVYYVAAAWRQAIGPEMLRTLVQAGIAGSDADIRDFITVTLIDKWDPIMASVQGWIEDKEKRERRAAIIQKIFITAFAVAVGAAAAASAKSAAEAAKTSGTALDTTATDALKSFRTGLTVIDKVTSARAAQGMNKLAEAMQTESPAFAAQVRETAFRMNPEAAAQQYGPQETPQGGSAPIPVSIVSATSWGIPVIVAVAVGVSLLGMFVFLGKGGKKP